MKKLLLLFLTMLFVSCNSTPKITYEKDVFKPENSRYQTDWFFFRLHTGSSVEFKLIKCSNDKIYIQGGYTLRRSFYVKNTDTVSLKFTDGTTINLNYNGILSDPSSSFNYFNIITKTKEINNLGTLEYIRAESSVGYTNSEKIKKEDADKLNMLFTRLKNNEYDKEN